MAGNSSETPTLLRQWSLIKSLSARRYGVTIKEVAEEMGVSLRTVRRDLQLFQELGFPLEEVAGDFGRKQWRIKQTWTEPQHHFTFDEAMALLMARRLLDPLSGSPIGQAAHRAFKKIRASLSDNVVKYLDRISQCFHVTRTGTSDYSEKSEFIDQILVGIEDAKVVFLTYRSQRATEAVTYEIHPYGMILHRGALYVVGFSLQHDEVRHWKVNRIEDAEATDFPFKRPLDFDLSTHMAGSFGVLQGGGQIAVKVQFLAPVVRYVTESQWHASQKLTPQPDGGVIAEFQLSSFDEIKSWLHSFGPHAIVLAPQQLRLAVKEDLIRTLNHYESAGIKAGMRGR